MRRLIVIFSFLIPLLVAMPASAQQGGVSGVYEYDGERIDGVEVELYKIADYDGQEFNFRTGYVPVNIGAMTNSELGEYGQALAQVAHDPEASAQTVDGEYAFAAMDEGIYLVTFKDITIGDYAYSALPIVLTMPDLNLNYHLELTTKLEKSCPDCEPEPEPAPPEEDEDNAYTHDQIRFYIGLMIVLIVIETLMLFVIIKERKREGENEN